ncbi:MAG: hypothetical protein JSR21_20740 [Proteobacteria bacterium]|nr:hypothetical protein [Pseudomonadota bacterium]
MRRRFLAAFAALLAAVPAAAAAQAAPRHPAQAAAPPGGDAPAVHHLAFKNGRASASGRVGPGRAAEYVFVAGEGEAFDVALQSSVPGVAFRLFAPGETVQAFFVGTVDGNRYQGTAPAAGEYRVVVSLEPPPGAAPPSRARFTLTVSLGGQVAAAPTRDFADALAGGPDRWRATGLAAGTTLALYDRPMASSPVVMRVEEGAMLRNLGCRFAGGQRWCLVAPDGQDLIQGWADGRYLREAAP